MNENVVNGREKTKNRRSGRWWKRALIILLLLIVLLCITALGLSFFMKASTEDRIAGSAADAAGFGADCILVLGCGVKDDGSPTPMLKDRLSAAVELYRQGAAPKILMSGDHGREGYDEVHAMKAFALEEGVPEEDIFLDHAGFSTYETMYRAREVFRVERAVVVTQRYHLYRALYNAQKIGIESCGYPADAREYAGQTMRELREIVARDKDWFQLILKPEPAYLGEAIPVSGDGTATEDI